MGRLTTHILDTAQGCPAADVSVTLYRIEAEPLLLKQDRTNKDGRLETPILEGADFKSGVYQLVFECADYFRKSTLKLDDPPFVDEVVLRFGIANSDDHYHVPLLVSPWSYSTYRGS